MAEVFDFIDDVTTGDLMIRNGDFVTGESTLQHQQDLLLGEKGQYRLYPDVGVSFQQFVNDNADFDDLNAAIQSEFVKDGMRIGKLVIKDIENIEISAQYNEQSSNGIR